MKKIKNNPNIASIPVVMQTAKASQKDKEEGISAGAFGYSSKPFKKIELLDIVNKAQQTND